MSEDNVKDSGIIKAGEQTSALSLTNSFKTFQVLAKSANTGIRNEGEALLMALKAKELGIGFGNAIPHMHVISGKPGIDIHIIKAILLRPSAMTTWELLEEYAPIYRYLTKDGLIFMEDELPKTYKEIKIVSVKDLPKLTNTPDLLHLAFYPNPENINLPEIFDRRTTYLFKRTSFFNGEKIVRTAKGSFSWRKALLAGLPYDKTGNLNPKSAWNSYRELMIAIRAFTFGAREIASDLLMGNYETTELFDMSGVDYDISVTENDTSFVEAEEVSD